LHDEIGRFARKSRVIDIRLSMYEKIKKLTKTFNEAKNGNESDTQIEKKQLDLEKAKEKSDMMKRDQILYCKAHEEFSKKFQILQVSDDEGPQ